jgi:hypothetical protein
VRLVLLVLLANAAISPATGQPRQAGPLVIQRSGAPDLRLAQFRGKIVVLALIFTTCPHCQDLTGELNQVAVTYSKRGVQVLECAFNDDAQGALPEFIERFRSPFPVGYTTQTAVRAFLRINPLEQKPFFVPHLLFIDRTGRIRAEYPGGDGFFQNAGANIRAQIEKLLRNR